jgi:hypothetical protein
MGDLTLIKRWVRPKILDKKSTCSFGGKQAYLEYARWYKKKGYPQDYKFRKAEKDYFIKLVTAFFRIVSEEIPEAKGGVSLRGIGYFFVHRIPKKLKFKTKTPGKSIELNYNHHTDHRVFSPLFIPRRTLALQPWAMDGKFSASVKKKLANNLRNGYRYKSHVATIKHIIG